MAPPTWLPNGLTLARCGLSVAIAAALVVSWGVPQSPATAAAFWMFLAAAATDLLDGWAARQLNAESAFGAWLDPIADKLLVGLVLAALVLTGGHGVLLALPALAIMARDVGVTLLRRRQGGGRALPVTGLAKWKTGLELGAIGLLLLPGAVPPELGAPADGPPPLGLGLLWLAAGLSVWTGWGYWRTFRGGART